jgi:hypothetical protein
MLSLTDNMVSDTKLSLSIAEERPFELKLQQAP